MLGFLLDAINNNNNRGRPASPQVEVERDDDDAGGADWVVLPRASPPMEMCSEEAAKYVWEGAIPLQIHLHESEVTTLPAPPPALVLGSRIGYLPFLIPLIKPHFYSTLPPGVDTVWFDYKGLPLKWYIPTGVLFDLLCPEPERPWNLTVDDDVIHLRKKKPGGLASTTAMVLIGIMKAIGICTVSTAVVVGMT